MIDLPYSSQKFKFGLKGHSLKASVTGSPYSHFWQILEDLSAELHLHIINYENGAWWVILLL